MPDELCRRICAVLLKRFEDTESAILVNGCILVKLLSFRFSHKTNVRNVFHIDLDTLTRILHLLIWLGNIFGIRQLYRHLAASGKHSIQAGDGSGVTTLTQLDPEHNQTGIGVSAPHILDQVQFFGCMLIGVAVWAVGTVCQ